jgi:hypothetical protein
LGTLLLTIPSRALAYRTFADDPAVGRPVRLPIDVLHWSLIVPTTVADASNVESATAAGVAVWSAPSCSAFRSTLQQLSTSEHAVAGDGISTIEIVTAGWGGRGLEPGRGATSDVQIVRNADGTAFIREADIYLDFDDYSWSVTAQSGTLDVQAVVTHEIGHALGLLHPCDPMGPVCGAADMTSTMFPTYRGIAGRELDADDVDGVCSLYPGAPCGAGCGDDQVCDGAVCLTVCATGDTTCHRCTGASCARSCNTSAECGFDVCAVVGAGEGACVGSRTFGAACSIASDCESRLCVIATLEPYCTTACTSDADCAGEGLVCSTVDGVHVCALPRPQSSCAVRPASGPLRILGIAFSLILLARLRRREGTS